MSKVQLEIAAGTFALPGSQIQGPDGPKFVLHTPLGSRELTLDGRLLIDPTNTLRRRTPSTATTRSN